MATKSGRILKNRHVNEEASECEPEDRRMQKKNIPLPRLEFAQIVKDKLVNCYLMIAIDRLF